jgi:hypothetical protein
MALAMALCLFFYWLCLFSLKRTDVRAEYANRPPHQHARSFLLLGALSARRAFPPNARHGSSHDPSAALVLRPVFAFFFASWRGEEFARFCFCFCFCFCV